MADETKKFMSADNLLYVWQKMKTLLSDKVDKVDGKGLSSNDYTSGEKTKLANIASGAQVNVLEGIQVNGSTVTPTNKIANINLSAYALKSDIASVYNVKGSITWTNLISKTDAKVGDVYNVTDKGGANYVCIVANTAGASSWDKLGETVDLSGYALKEDLGSLAYKNSLGKSDVGLGNVDNTSDLNKPISTATQNALNLKANASALTNYVDKSSNQTIEGVKTFKEGIMLNNNHYGNTDAIEIDGGILSSPNLNNITTRGIYHCSQGTNTPSFDNSNSNYDLMVFNSSEAGVNLVTQIAIVGWKWWIRRKDSSWGAWERFGASTEINELTNAEIDTIFAS